MFFIKNFNTKNNIEMILFTNQKKLQSDIIG